MLKLPLSVWISLKSKRIKNRTPWVTSKVQTQTLAEKKDPPNPVRLLPQHWGGVLSSCGVHLFWEGSRTAWHCEPCWQRLELRSGLTSPNARKCLLTGSLRRQQPGWPRSARKQCSVFHGDSAAGGRRRQGEGCGRRHCQSEEKVSALRWTQTRKGVL